MPFLSPSAFGQRLAKGDADVFHAVVGIDVQITARLDGEIDRAVARHLLQHVLQEGDLHLRLETAETVQIQMNLDLCFERVALHAAARAGMEKAAVIRALGYIGARAFEICIAGWNSSAFAGLQSIFAIKVDVSGAHNSGNATLRQLPGWVEARKRPGCNAGPPIVLERGDVILWPALLECSAKRAMRGPVSSNRRRSRPPDRFAKNGNPPRACGHHSLCAQAIRTEVPVDCGP